MCAIRMQVNFSLQYLLLLSMDLEVFCNFLKIAFLHQNYNNTVQSIKERVINRISPFFYSILLTNRWGIWHGGFANFLIVFSVFNETKILIFMHFWKLSTIDSWYSHNFFAIWNIKKSPCQTTDIIIILTSTNFEKTIFKSVDGRPCTKKTYKIQNGGQLLRNTMKNWIFFNGTE